MIGGYTGTPDVSQRCEVIGNPLANIPAGTYFNPAAYAMPALATGPDNSIVGPPALGDQGGGAGALTYPHVTNFDLTMTKNIPLGSEKRVLKFQAQAYNAFNHPEFNAHEYRHSVQSDYQRGLQRYCRWPSNGHIPGPCHGVLSPAPVLDRASAL